MFYYYLWLSVVSLLLTFKTVIPDSGNPTDMFLTSWLTIVTNIHLSKLIVTKIHNCIHFPAITRQWKPCIFEMEHVFITMINHRCSAISVHWNCSRLIVLMMDAWTECEIFASPISVVWVDFDWLPDAHPAALNWMGKKIRWKNSWIEMKEGTSLTGYYHWKNRLGLIKGED